ncbi:major facilitator superfamily domain-containing protein [Trichophaea hybrida]|nr:major facilitator superfamily domain-containing protein [Trichophaea hybrida]
MSTETPTPQFAAEASPDAGENEGSSSLKLSRTVSEAYSAFTPTQKQWIVLLVGIASFFSPLSANIYFPALSSLSNQLNVSAELINLTITSYMIFQALAPTLFGELADSLGRRPVYILLFAIYICANIGLALQRSYPALIVLRMLQSTGSSGVIALAIGVVADISHAGERGVYMGAVNIGTLLGPAIGPVIGGALANQLGWWWIFYFLIILSSMYIVPLLLVFPETGRRVVGNGSTPPSSRINKSFLPLLSPPGTGTPLPRPPLEFPNPLACIRLLFEKDMAIVLFANGILCTACYTVIASLPSLFLEIYGLNSLKIGLCYLPFGAGCAVASVGAGKIIDRDYRVVAKQNGITINKRKGEDMARFPIEDARLRSVFWMLAVYAATFAAYGWVLYVETSIAVPLVLQFICGVFAIGVFTIFSTLVVDLYPMKPSSAAACNNLVRCLMGAGGTAAIDSMISTMGRGWCFTFVGAMCAAMAPLLWVERRWGMRWRWERAGRGREVTEERVEGVEGEGKV